MSNSVKWVLAKRMVDPSSDVEWLQSSRRGDREALRRLYQRYSAPLFCYLTGILRSRTDAEDVLQELFVKLSRGAPLPVTSSVKGYLFSMARNLAYDWRKRHAKWRNAGAVESLLQPARDEQDHNGVARREEAHRVQAALLSLSDEGREIVTLKTYANVTFEEASQWLGVPQDTLYSRYQSALEQLRSLLRETR